jgi:hypothetical protein
MSTQGCLAAYLQGNTGHTAEQREKVDRSHFIVAARQRVVDDFHGDLQSALASSRNGQFGNGKGSSGMSAEDLKAAQAQRNRDINAARKRGMAQLKITKLAWEGLPLAVRKRVQADPLLTLAQAKSGSVVQPQPAPAQPGVQQQPVQESRVQQQPVQQPVQPVQQPVQPDFDFTNDDDIEDI